MTTIHGLGFEPPADFAVAEVMVTMRGPSVASLSEPRAMQAQMAIRPNLIVHRRELPAAASLDLLCGEMCAELLSSIDQLTNLETSSFSFADGADGRLIQFDFKAGKAPPVRQYQLLRTDGLTFTTMTLSVSLSTLSDEQKARYFNALASMGAPGAAA